MLTEQQRQIVADVRRFAELNERLRKGDNAELVDEREWDALMTRLAGISVLGELLAIVDDLQAGQALLRELARFYVVYDEMIEAWCGPKAGPAYHVFLDIYRSLDRARIKELINE